MRHLQSRRHREGLLQRDGNVNFTSCSRAVNTNLLLKSVFHPFTNVKPSLGHQLHKKGCAPDVPRPRLAHLCSAPDEGPNWLPCHGTRTLGLLAPTWCPAPGNPELGLLPKDPSTPGSFTANESRDSGLPRGLTSGWTSLCFLICFSFYGCTRSIWKFPGQGSNPSCGRGLHHGHGNTRSELHLGPTPQLAATPDP